MIIIFSFILFYLPKRITFANQKNKQILKDEKNILRSPIFRVISL